MHRAKGDRLVRASVIHVCENGPEATRSDTTHQDKGKDKDKEALFNVAYLINKQHKLCTASSSSPGVKDWVLFKT